MALPLTASRPGEETPLQLACALVNVTANPDNIVHQVKIISLLQIGKAQGAAVAMAGLQGHLDILLIDIRIRIVLAV